MLREAENASPSSKAVRSSTTTAGDVQKRFEEQGFVILRQVVEADVVEQARAAMQTLVDQCASQLMADGKISDPMIEEPFDTRLAKLYANCLDNAPQSFRKELHLAGLFGLFFHPRLLDVVESLLGEEIRLYPNYTARPKFPDWEGTLVLWHQDGGYTAGGGAETNGVMALRMVNVWSPLVPAREANGCMQFIPGTHKLGVVPHEVKRYYMEIAPEHLKPRESQAVSIELDPGDVVLFHNLLFHRGLPNHTDKIRWSLDWRYQDATQPTLREHLGHLARSRSKPEQVVQTAEEWAKLSFR